jgi:isoleucyl-tRNA synthetase
MSRRELAGTVARHRCTSSAVLRQAATVLAGDFVTTDQGTGLVHMAPDHGEDDFELCKADGIDPVFAVDGGGFYRPTGCGSAGRARHQQQVQRSGRADLLRPARGGRLARGERGLSAQLPHSWRSKAKVIYRCTPQWFVRWTGHCGNSRRSPARAALGE